MSKVFVIDDSVSVCVAVERMLGEHGFDVVWEQDAVTALNTVEKHHPDLIICDVVLPEIDGFEVCRSLRANPLLGETPVLLISGAVDDRVHNLARSVGAAAVIEKPFTAEQLVESVQTTLGAVEPASKELWADPQFEAEQRRLMAEVDGLSGLDSRYVCLLGNDGTIRAATGEADSNSRTGEIENELRWLRGLMADAAQGAGGPEMARLSFESSKGLFLVELLDDGLQLLAAFADARSLGKARLLVRRLRGRLRPNVAPQ